MTGVRPLVVLWPVALIAAMVWTPDLLVFVALVPVVLLATETLRPSE